MALIQIEEDLFNDMVDRIAFLRKLFFQLYERFRSRGIDDWLTMEQVCDILNISKTKAYSFKRGGRIGYIKCGKTLRFNCSDTYSLLEHFDKTADA